MKRNKNVVLFLVPEARMFDAILPPPLTPPLPRASMITAMWFILNYISTTGSNWLMG